MILCSVLWMLGKANFSVGTRLMMNVRFAERGDHESSCFNHFQFQEPSKLLKSEKHREIRQVTFVIESSTSPILLHKSISNASSSRKSCRSDPTALFRETGQLGGHVETEISRCQERLGASLQFGEIVKGWSCARASACSCSCACGVRGGNRVIPIMFELSDEVRKRIKCELKLKGCLCHGHWSCKTERWICNVCRDYR